MIVSIYFVRFLSLFAFLKLQSERSEILFVHCYFFSERHHCSFKSLFVLKNLVCWHKRCSSLFTIPPVQFVSGSLGKDGRYQEEDAELEGGDGEPVRDHQEVWWGCCWVLCQGWSGLNTIHNPPNRTGVKLCNTGCKYPLLYQLTDRDSKCWKSIFSP